MRRPWLLAIVYLNFDGVTLTSAPVDDATMDQSSLAAATVPAFDGTPLAPLVPSAVAREVVADRVRAYFAPFDVDVVTTRPVAGPYTMAVIGGAHGLVTSNAVAGLSVIDCPNAELSNVVFAFSDDHPPLLGGTVGLAITVAHRLGHSFGLEHTDGPDDLMYSVAQPIVTLPQWFQLSFATGYYSSYRAGQSPAPSECGRPNPLDNFVILGSALGTRVHADAIPPEVQWLTPALSSTVPTPVAPTFDVEVTATDLGGILRVEIYRNFELYAAVSEAPYRATLPATTEAFYVTVDVIDGALNRRASSRAFVLEAAPPPADLGSTDASPMMEPPPRAGGCSFAR